MMIIEFVAVESPAEFGSFGFRDYKRRNRGNLSNVAGVLKIGEYVIAEVFDKGMVQVRSGKGCREMRHLYVGNPTASFWSFWKRKKSAMRAAGLSVKKSGGAWEVAWWRRDRRKL